MALASSSAALIDLVSFVAGPTRQVLAAAHSGALWPQDLSVAVPLQGRPQAALGVGDLAFLVAIYYVLQRSPPPRVVVSAARGRAGGGWLEPVCRPSRSWR